MSSGTPKSSGSSSELSSGGSSSNESSFQSSSSACTCDIMTSWEWNEDHTIATILVLNLGTCDLTFDVTDDGAGVATPDTDVPLPSLGSAEITVTSVSSLEGTTVSIITDHCGTYTVYLGTTAPPPP